MNLSLDPNTVQLSDTYGGVIFNHFELHRMGAFQNPHKLIRTKLF